jgi:signal transduction histidine kinase
LPHRIKWWFVVVTGQDNSGRRGHGFVDRLLPEALRRAPEERRRALVIVALSVITGFTVLLSGVGHFVRGGNAAGWIATICALLLFALPFSLSRVSLDVVANLCLLVLTAVLALATLMRGGLGTPPAMGLAAIPMFALLIAGRRSAVVWAIVNVFVLVVMLALHFRGDLESDMVVGPMRAPINMVAGVVFLGCLLAIGLEYEHRKNEAMRRVGEQAERLVLAEQARAEAETTTQVMRAQHLASLGQLAAGAAHEINNPLFYILANIGTIEKRIRRGEDTSGRDLLEAAQDALIGAKQIQRIVRDLKTYTRVDHEERGPVDVSEVIHTVLKMADNETRHRAKVECEIIGDTTAMASRSRLGQVLLNLVINAAQAIPDGRADENHILIRAERLADRVVIEVRDSGVGIPPELLEKVTQPFFTTKPVGVGTGLGLSACVNLVDGLNGTFVLESELGVGTIARIELEASDESASPRESYEGLDEPRGSAAVLVIDDDEMVSRALCRMLARHEVTVASSGEEALEMLADGFEPDLILCDLMMPNMTGMEVYAVVAERYPALTRCFAFISGGAFSPSARQFLADFDGLLVSKPFSEVELHELLHAVCAEMIPERQRA